MPFKVPTCPRESDSDGIKGLDPHNFVLSDREDESICADTSGTRLNVVIKSTVLLSLLKIF